MAAVGKPKRPADAPRAIRAPPPPGCWPLRPRSTPSREPWPQWDLALVATFCATGIREGEAVARRMASVAGEAGARHLEVVGKGSKARSIPIDTPSRPSWTPTRPPGGRPSPATTSITPLLRRSSTSEAVA